MVADAAEIAWTGVGAERLVAGVAGVADHEERDPEHVEAASGRKERGGEGQVYQFPLTVKAYAPELAIL